MKPKSKVTRRDLIKNAGLAGAAVATGGLIAPMPAAAQAPQVPARWDREADVVIIGAGATGMPAAIVARKAGSSVIVIDANSDIGGHAICSGANIPLGGGTSLQKKAGIDDSPDLVFQDLTDWSVVQPNGAPDYRYNDKEIIRAFADNCAQTFEFLVENGVKFVKDVPTAAPAARTAIRCRARCTSPCSIGRRCRPDGRSIRRTARRPRTATA